MWREKTRLDWLRGQHAMIYSTVLYSNVRILRRLRRDEEAWYSTIGISRSVLHVVSQMHRANKIAQLDD